MCRKYGSVTPPRTSASAQSQAAPAADPSPVDRSARNRFVGLVTDIVMDKVMAQVELQCGPYRVIETPQGVS